MGQVPFAPLIKRLMVLLEQPISLASSGWLMLCSFIKSARRTLDGAGRYSCAMKSDLLFELFPHYNTLCRFVQYTVSSPPLLLQPCNQQGHFSFSVAVLPLFRLSSKIFRIFRQEAKNTRVPTLGSLLQYITSTCPVAAGCGVL